MWHPCWCGPVRRAQAFTAVLQLLLSPPLARHLPVKVLLFLITQGQVVVPDARQMLPEGEGSMIKCAQERGWRGRRQQLP